MGREENRNVLCSEENLRMRNLLLVLVTSSIPLAFPSYGKTKGKNPYDEKRLLEQNRRIQKENNAPEDFPNFVREGLYFNSVFLLVLLFSPMDVGFQKLYTSCLGSFTMLQSS